ncbi:unnamed protein product [Dicrocoelium dendriticum]|nr:unnamed protein product [Dicrocoelium dendriticum]
MPHVCDANISFTHLQLVNLTRVKMLSDLSPYLESTCMWNGVNNLALTHSGLTELEPNVCNHFAYLEHLNISNNARLTTYGENTFASACGRLTALILRSNPVRSLARNVFAGLTALSVLDLSDNKIGYIQSGTFSSNCCSMIRRLNLAANILTVIDVDTLRGLSRLEVLDLRGNPLQQIDSAALIPCASSLSELYMSHDNRVPFGGFESPAQGVFSNLSNLLILRMEELKLVHLTNETFQGLSNLQELSLRGNRITQLPPDVFSHTTKLKRLDLSSNTLMCVPSSLNPAEKQDFLAGLPLRWVDLSWNRLTHLNHLTARSLGLFDARSNDDGRLILNLTANPWQHVDEDTFCNPIHPTPMRPTELILGPSVTSHSEGWKDSVGYWRARAAWPNGPLSLIGQSSLLHGFLLTGNQMQNISNTNLGVSSGVEGTLTGISDSRNKCLQLEQKQQTKLNGTVPKDPQNFQWPSAAEIIYSISSYCPRLPIRKMGEKELLILNLSDVIDTYYPSRGSFLHLSEQGSRLYLLTTVGLCLTFILTALTVIMCYRAWSRRTSLKDLEDHVAVNNGAHCRKKPMRYTPCSTHQNDPCHPADKEDRSTESLLRSTSQLESDGPTPVQSCPSTTVPSTHPKVKRIAPSGGSRVMCTRPKSDSDATGLGEAQQLTVFGVV